MPALADKVGSQHPGVGLHRQLLPPTAGADPIQILGCNRVQGADCRVTAELDLVTWGCEKPEFDVGLVAGQQEYRLGEVHLPGNPAHLVIIEDIGIADHGSGIAAEESVRKHVDLMYFQFLHDAKANMPGT